MIKNHTKTSTLKRPKRLSYQGIKLNFLILSILNFGFAYAQSQKIEVASFDEVVISPYIEVVFKSGNEESLTIDKSKVDLKKINIEVKGHKLYLFLDDAKVVGKREDVIINGNKRRQEIYQGTQASATINYKVLRTVEIRGEEQINFPDTIRTEDFDLDLYGSPKVYMEGLNAEKFKVALYGESYLEIKSGTVNFQRYRTYGTSEINAIALESEETKIAAYGDNHVVVTVSDRLKVSAFGDARIEYKGNAQLKNGLSIGDTHIKKID